MQTPYRLFAIALGLVLSLAAGCGDSDTNLVDGPISPDSDGDTTPGDDGGGDNGCPLLQDGETCESDPQCCSNNCAEGVCATTPDTCDPAGTPCAGSVTCCSGACVDNGSGTFVCGQGVGTCEAIGGACTTASDCCSLGCSSGLCVDQVCSVAGETCAANEECCSNRCEGDVCVDDGRCGAAGEACGQNSDCCTDACLDFGGGDMRCAGGSACRVIDEVCTEPDDCCSFNCVNGFCTELPGGNSCKSVGEVCETDTSCCSFTCRANDAGVKTCRYLGGCRPVGELCREDADCCNAAVGGTCVKATDQDVGRCGAVGGCAPAGEVCGIGSGGEGGSNECCPGHDNGGDANCVETSSGTERCLSSDGQCKADGLDCQEASECCSGICEGNVCGETACVPSGESCAFSEQCCDDGVCAPDPTTGELVCNPECIAEGDACTSDSDCCGGYCDVQTLTCGFVDPE